ncbi:hypothetical protein IPG41_05730 [Candidatus Peregrinibacteria bacterium]|nr:MAG: hypothetical protein IPG41_05730 [Candidatus Peregrinibacteria bacterium]
MGQAARKLDGSREVPDAVPGSDRRNPRLDEMRGDLKNRVQDVMDRMKPANDDGAFREEASPAAEAGGGHGHGAATKKSKKPTIPELGDETIADLIETGTTVRDFYRKYRKGEVTTPDIARLFNDALDTLGLDKLRAGSNVYAWLIGLALGIPNHPPEKITPNYTDLTGQILGFHPDEDNPQSYHHSVEGLMATINEMDLHRHYSLFFHQPNFTKALSTAKGQKKANEQFSKLFGPDIETRAQFLNESTQVLLRLGCHITPGPNAADPTVGEHIHIHDLRNVHANHSLHTVVQAMQNARQWVTEANVAQIAEPATEDVKLSKDMQKFGDTLMEHVKGNTGLVVQFLGNIEPLAAYEKAFHALASDQALEEGMYEEPDAVREQICQLFNFSPKERITADDLNSFTEALIGPTPAPATAPYPLDPDNGGALGLLSAIPATDTVTRAKWAAIRTRINEARARLLATPTGATLPATRLGVLFPPKSETIDYAKFGNQLGKAVRGKTGVNLRRARSAFLRGWERDEFRDHFINLMDPTLLTAVLDGTKTDKDALKTQIEEVTGVKVTRMTQALFRSRILAKMNEIGDGTPGNDVDPDVRLKQTALRAMLSRLARTVLPSIDPLYQEESLERNLGTTVNAATPANLSGIFDKLNAGFFVRNYGLLNQTPAAVMALAPAQQQQFKAQLAGFIGAPRNLSWNDGNVTTLLGELTRQAAVADRLSRTGTHGNSAHLRTFIAHATGFVGTPVIPHMATLP